MPSIPLATPAETETEPEELDNEFTDLEEESARFFANVDAIEQEDVPDYMVEEGEKTSKDPDYQFCPAVHRKPLLHLFTKHYCQSELFPERLETEWTAESIRRNAVIEMYRFCYQRGLREVWGYMWACWYSPKMWKLWARSGTKFISRLRTTMNVENFWKQLKHDYLHQLIHPRLDQLVWILIHEVTPDYYVRTLKNDDEYRLGRAKELTTFQAAFKKAWVDLEKRELGTTSYITDVKTWTCNCGQQKYQSHHLCKHLVQAVKPSAQFDPNFWRQIRRRRVRPLYRHPELVPKGENSSVYTSDDEGCVTDGDDHLWSGNPDCLRNGNWRDLGSSTELGKRSRESSIVSASDSVLLERGDDNDLEAFQSDQVRSSSPVCYGIEGEIEVSYL
jgi:hypothetical protein